MVDEVGTAVETPRPASPTPAAPRTLHRTRRRDSRVARAELLEMEREARALREDDARVRNENDKNPNPPPRVHDREPARCRVPRYPPQLPRSLEVVPTIFVLEAKARREEEEVMEEEEREEAEYARKTIKHEEERRERERRKLAAAWAKVKSVAASSRARAAALATERARAEAERARAEAEAAAAAARAARESLEKIQTRLRGSDDERFR